MIIYMTTIKEVMESVRADDFEQLGGKFTDYIGLIINMEGVDYRYVVSFNEPSLFCHDAEGPFEVVYSIDNVRIDTNKNVINGMKIKEIQLASKKDLTPKELFMIFSDVPDVFGDTEKFQKFYGLMTDKEDKTEPPYFIQKENLMMKIGHLEEELAEIKKAAENGDLTEFADGIIDLIYVASGLGNLCRLPMHQLWNDVQNSNMVGKVRVKSLDDATKRGSTFDVKKGPGWVGPRGAEIIQRAAEIREKNKNQG